MYQTITFEPADATMLTILVNNAAAALLMVLIVRDLTPQNLAEKIGNHRKHLSEMVNRKEVIGSQEA